MDRDSIERFVRRDWSAAAAFKEQYWAERFQHEGSHAIWDAAQSLLEHVRRVRPDFPTADERARDLAHHADLRARLARAAHAFAGR